MNMIKIELFVVLFPIGYLSTILIAETNKSLNYTLDLDEFMIWVR